MATLFHMYGEILVRGSDLTRVAVSQSFMSNPTEAHATASDLLKDKAIAYGLDLEQFDFIVKSLTRLGDSHEC